MATNKVSCHCGKIALEFDGEITEGMSCNCSICQRRGSILTFLPSTAVRFTAGEGEATVYTFNKHHIQHRFCSTCGILPYADGDAPDGSRMVAVNLRCVEGIDLNAIKITHHDGAAG